MLSSMDEQNSVPLTDPIAVIASNFAVEVERCAKLRIQANAAIDSLQACEKRVCELADALEQKRAELLGQASKASRQV